MTTIPVALERRVPSQRHAAAHVAQYIHELSARHARDRHAAERLGRRALRRAILEPSGTAAQPRP